MKIKDLRDGIKRADIIGQISAIGEARTITLRNGEEAKVADATLRDETGTIVLPLWREQTTALKVGNRVEIVNGYVTSYLGALKLNVGRYGQLNIISV